MEKLFNSITYKVFRLQKTFNLLWVKLLKYIIYIAAILVVAYWLFAYWQILSIDASILRLGCLVIIAAIIFLVLDMFAKYSLEQVDIAQFNKDRNNIFDFFSDEALTIMEKFSSFCQKYQIKNFNLSAMVFAIPYLLKGKYFLLRSKITIDEKEEITLLTQIAGHPGKQEKLQEFIDDLLVEAKQNKHSKIEFSDLILSLYKNNPYFSHLLEEVGIKIDDLKTILSWTKMTFSSAKNTQEIDYTGGIGRDWASGYTPVLNLFSVDIGQYLKNAQLEYLSKTRTEIIKEMEDVLAKSGKNNVILVGNPGVGKKTIINSFAQKVMRGESYKSLNYKHIVQIDVAKILAGAANQGELEARFVKIFEEVTHAGNIILYFSDFTSLINAYSGQMGTVDASAFLIPYLESGIVQVVALANYDDFKNKLQTNPNMEALFSKIEVKEMRKEEVLPSLEHLILFIETKHKILFTYQAVKDLIELADRYIHDEVFPQKAADLLREIGIRAENQGTKFIDEKFVNEFISARTKIPVGKIQDEEKDKLLHLEEFLHRRIIGQEEAIAAVANALRRSRANISGSNKPIGSFLFIGPTGVGKTETAKALAESFYGSENNMIRFDMSEFQEVSTIDRLIGSKIGHEFSPGRLTQAVINNPYSLVLFDEIEKAHPNILNLFLQILDEGKITDAQGRSADFTNTIIIATSNAGSEKIREYVMQNISAEELGRIIIDYLLKQGMFRPEFINRFDKVVCYKPLTMEQIVEVAKLMLTRLNKNLAEKNIKITLTPIALDKLAKAGFDPVFGARALRRIVQEKIENIIAKKIIEESLKEGQTLIITEKDL